MGRQDEEVDPSSVEAAMASTSLVPSTHIDNHASNRKERRNQSAGEP